METLPENATPEEPGPATDRAPEPRALHTASFPDMRLKVGDQLHLELPKSVADGRVVVAVLGWLEGVSVMVTAPQMAASQLMLLEGEMVLLRAFIGRSVFAFRSKVLKAAHQPFQHLHLSFPEKVQSVKIRSSPRCRVCLPADISSEGRAVGQGNIVNIGTAGALIETVEPLTQELGVVQISCSFELHEVPVSLNLRARLCGSKDAPTTDGTPRHQYGVEFEQLLPNDRLMLGSLVWYQMYEFPQSIS